jgi:hypothetical protein
MPYCSTVGVGGWAGVGLTAGGWAYCRAEINTYYLNQLSCQLPACQPQALAPVLLPIAKIKKLYYKLK